MNSIYLILILLSAKSECFLLQTYKKGDICKKTMMHITKEHLKRFSMCTREVYQDIKRNDEEFKTKLGCIVKCSLREDNLLDESGKVTQERLEKWSEVYLPYEIRQVSWPMVEGCLEDSVPQMNNDDPQCSTGYIDYLKCVQELVTNLC